MVGEAARDVAALLEARAGLDFTRSGERLARAIAARRQLLRLPSDDSYCGRILAGDTRELQALIDAVTVTYTWLFRDPVQLEAIRAALIERRGRRVRVWIPGCATGDDAYTIALLASASGVDVEVLGTDVNQSALARAREGVFQPWAARDVPQAFAGFLKPTGNRGFVRCELGGGLRFEAHSLVDPVPQPDSDELWDLILCRNVLMYFTPDATQKTLQALARALAPGGELFLGPSEILIRQPPGLEPLYRFDRLSFRNSPPLQPPGTTRRAPSAVASASVAAPSPKGKLEASPAPKASPGLGALQSELAIGHARLERGELDAALRAYRAASEEDATNAEACLYSGLVLFLLNDHEAAAMALRAALFHDPDLPLAAFYLGLCHESAGQLGQASQQYRRVRGLSRTPPRVELPSCLASWQQDIELLADMHLTRLKSGGRR